MAHTIEEAYKALQREIGAHAGTTHPITWITPSAKMCAHEYLNRYLLFMQRHVTKSLHADISMCVDWVTEHYDTAQHSDWLTKTLIQLTGHLFCFHDLRKIADLTNDYFEEIYNSFTLYNERSIATLAIVNYSIDTRYVYTSNHHYHQDYRLLGRFLAVIPELVEFVLSFNGETLRNPDDKKYSINPGKLFLELSCTRIPWSSNFQLLWDIISDHIVQNNLILGIIDNIAVAAQR